MDLFITFSKDIPMKRVKRWGFSLRELLNDPIGREQFTKFLDKEFSGENLKFVQIQHPNMNPFSNDSIFSPDRFWEAIQDMKAQPQSKIKDAANAIWNEYLAPDAACPVNIDSKSLELAREAISGGTGNQSRWCFDVAADHVFYLMKSDSYSRYLRSDMYKEYLNGSKKKVKSIPNLFGVKINY